MRDSVTVRSETRPIRSGAISRLLRLPARDRFKLAIYSLLDAADCQEVDPRFHPTGFNPIADLESPFPDPRCWRGDHRIFNAPVHHRTSPACPKTTEQ